MVFVLIWSQIHYSFGVGITLRKIPEWKRKEVMIDKLILSTFNMVNTILVYVYLINREKISFV